MIPKWTVCCLVGNFVDQLGLLDSSLSHQVDLRHSLAREISVHHCRQALQGATKSWRSEKRKDAGGSNHGTCGFQRVETSEKSQRWAPRCSNQPSLKTSCHRKKGINIKQEENVYKTERLDKPQHGNSGMTLTFTLSFWVRVQHHKAPENVDDDWIVHRPD